MISDDVIRTLQERETELRARGVLHAALFGSTARGTATVASDIDIMLDVDLEVVGDIYDYVGLKEYIASLFPGRVDIVNRAGLKPYLGRPWKPTLSMPSNRQIRNVGCSISSITFGSHTDSPTGLLTSSFETTSACSTRTRCLEIISEASRRLPPDLKDRHPSIPWARIAGAGNVYRHDYEDVDQHLVWQAIRHRLPELLIVTEHELGAEPHTG